MKSRTSLILLLFLLFLAAGLLVAYFSFQSELPTAIAEKISIQLDRELRHLESDADKVKKTVLDTTMSASGSPFSYFLYRQGKLMQWTNNQWIPPASIFADTFDIKLIHDSGADFLVRRWTLSSQQFLVALIPLQRSFKITNEYVSQEWNRSVFPSGNIHILDPNATLGVPVCIDSRCFFRVSFFPEEIPTHVKSKIVSVILLTASLLLLIVLIYRFLPSITSRSSELGLLYLYASLTALRFLMVSANFPNALIQFEVFNPQVFASSTMNASLGDLFLNMLAILALCYYVFRRYKQFRIIHYLRQTSYSWVVLTIAGICFLFAFLFPFITVQTLYNNSSLPLTLSQSLQFDMLRLIAMAIIMLAGACSFLFAHVCMRIMIGEKNTYRVFLCLLGSCLLFAAINELSGQHYIVALVIAVLYFCTIYFLKLYRRLNRFQYGTFVYLFVGVFYLSASAAYATNFFSRQENIENQFRFARNFLIDRDYFGEYLLREASQKIAADRFIQSRMFSPFLGKDAIRQKIRQVFLPSYFNKYDVEILLFNAMGSSMDNEEQRPFQEYISVYDQETFRTEYTGVYFVDNPQADITQKYLAVIPVRKMKSIAGHIVVALSLKRIIPENVYPELLVDNRFQEFYRTQELSYAVFAAKKVQFTSGNFNYERLFNLQWLGEPDLYTHGMFSSGYDHIAQEDQNGRVAVVSALTVSPARAFADFSFLFVTGLAVILLIIMIQGALNFVNGNNLFFSARIQLILNLSFFLPLILVSATTLSLTSRSSKLQLDEEYRNKAKSFAQQLTNDVDDNRNDNSTELDERLADIAKISNLDANLYSTAGQLTGSSQPLIVESGLISPYINPEALYKVRNGENLFIENERIGNLQYFVAYSALKSPITGKMGGILGIPFFQSGYSLEKAQITILANILNIFAGIFIVLLVLSYFVSRWLTFPLTFITQSLKRTSLVKANQPIIWNANDEIGLMAKEYNKMLFTLSESKAELEQTQREKAWREIAQQVAHEIKNPLTPMKLMLQQLERAMQQGSPAPEKIEKSVSALLTQVNTLNDIASSFSSFARMPEPVMQRIELVSLIRRIVDLHSQSAELHFSAPVKELFVTADDQLLGRTFSNIILNATQAARPGVASRLDISLQKEQRTCIIKFQDNGKGMTDEVAERIFVPHFTTKKSGSGLGLAIARQGIEHMNGRIWFETRVGHGTTFYISLPL